MEKDLMLAGGFTNFDIQGSRNPHVRGDFCLAPFKSCRFDLILFDPPHLTDFGTVKNKQAYGSHPLVQRYGGFKNIGDMRKSLYLAFREIARMLAPDGILIFKWGEYIKNIEWVLRMLPSELREEKRVLVSQRRNNTRRQRTFFVWIRKKKSEVKD